MWMLTVASAGLAALIAGCKEPPPPIVAVEGIVLLDGKPLKNAQVRFIPQIEHGPEFIATAVTDGGGRFKLMCNGQHGACAGENYVVIDDGPIPAKLLNEDAQLELQAYLRSLGGRPPLKYGNLADTPLTALVSEEQKVFVFDLIP
jgi:hypothetical protein